jgi:hypothetical protein
LWYRRSPPEINTICSGGPVPEIEGILGPIVEGKRGVSFLGFSSMGAPNPPAAGMEAGGTPKQGRRVDGALSSHRLNNLALDARNHCRIELLSRTNARPA